MALMRWDPFRELEDMSSRLNRIFGPRTEAQTTLATADWAPTVDIVEQPEEFLVKAELPEMKKEDVKVTVEGGTLVIRGERKLEKEEKGRKFHRIERSYGSFMRSFTLPDNVDAAHVRAEYKDGLLSVRLPKVERKEAKATEVKVS